MPASWSSQREEQEVHIPFPLHTGDRPPFQHDRNLFDARECEMLRLALGYAPVSYHAQGESSTECSMAVIPMKPEYQWVYERVAQMVDRYNAKMGYALSGFTESLVIFSYEPGQYIEWHSDYIGHDVSKLTVSVQLSPQDYTGGEFDLLNIDTPTLKEGDALCFPSFVAHRVRRVTAGCRYSLSGWIAGPPFR